MIDNSRSIGFWIYGDGRGLVARARLRDSDGTTFQISGDPITWHGWRFVELPILSLSDQPHWGGNDQSGIDFPITWDSIFLLDNVSREPVEGEIYLSAPTLIR